MGKDKKKMPKHPSVTLCTPTFNRRPFIPIMLKCFEHQTYPKDKIEWLIVDDGTDKIEDLVSHIPQIKYFKFDEKMTLGQKRNFLNEKATGDIIIFIDDDDYYPPERISHAVETLRQNPKALCVGSSAMFIYFKHINKMYQFGPYGPTHATAATFAFRKELLTKTKFNENSSVAEEKQFLKDYTIPFAQLDPKKSILVFSHTHNSFDKKELLKQMPNPTIHDTNVLPSDLVKEADILKFFMEDIDEILNNYAPGKPENKPDVTKQITKIKETRELDMKKQIEQQQNLNKLQMLLNGEQMQKNLQEQQICIQELTNQINRLTSELNQMRDKNQYLENKMKQLITEKIQEKKNS